MNGAGVSLALSDIYIYILKFFSYPNEYLQVVLEMHCLES